MGLAAGTFLGPYEIVAPLGSGGVGEVYRALDPRIGRGVAIKVLLSQVSEAAGEKLLQRFEHEARAAGTLNHPNIVAVYDVGSQDGRPYVVSELLEGTTLREKLAGGALPSRKAVEYAIQIAHALAAAHEKKVVHRDLKPENIFITKDGRIKVLDFGLAKLMPQPTSGSGSTEATPAGTVLGTLGYMSPEQIRGRSVDPRSDLFSLGAVLYEMLYGRRPFKGDTPADTMTAILSKDPPENLAILGPLGPTLQVHGEPLPGKGPAHAVSVRTRPRLRPRDARLRIRRYSCDIAEHARSPPPLARLLARGDGDGRCRHRLGDHSAPSRHPGLDPDAGHLGGWACRQPCGFPRRQAARLRV
jgi:serine/threonine protein kinase